MALDLLFIIDPISKLSVKKDTSFAFMEAAQERGHNVHVCRVGDLWAHGDEPRAQTRLVEVRRQAVNHHWLDEPTEGDLRDFDAIFMRKDPPFDMEYVYATYILSLARESGTLVMNDPGGLRDCNEKAYILNFPDIIPETIVTRRARHIKDFLEKYGEAIIKPLNAKGGEGILMLRRFDLNTNSMIELLTANGTEFAMVQRFIPEAKSGDKRILMIGGEPVGAFLRIPADDDLRGNMSAGATVQAADITDRDREVIQQLRPRLQKDGHVFVGIDLLGPWLTEINVTSPTGVQEVKALCDIDVATRMIEWTEKHA